MYISMLICVPLSNSQHIFNSVRFIIRIKSSTIVHYWPTFPPQPSTTILTPTSIQQGFLLSVHVATQGMPDVPCADSQREERRGRGHMTRWRHRRCRVSVTRSGLETVVLLKKYRPGLRDQNKWWKWRIFLTYVTFFVYFSFV